MNPIELKDLLDSIGPEDAEEASGIDRCWEDLVNGDLDETEVRRLGALAGTGGSHQLLGDLFEPLDDDFHHRTVDRLAGLLPASPEGITARAAPDRSVPVSRKVEPSPAIVSPRPAEPWWTGLVRWLRSGWVVTPVLVMAAALLFLRQPADLSLPDYEVEVHGGDHQLRGGEPSPSTLPFSQGSRIDVVLFPKHDVQGPVHAAAFRRDDTRWVDAGLSVEVGQGGAIRATGTIGDGIPAVPGRVELAIVITAADKEPASSWIGEEPAPGVVVVTTSVDVRAR